MEIIYPSSNAEGIPDLVLEPPSVGAPPLIAPFNIWGSVARKTRMDGTYAFYTDDPVFEDLWGDPQALLVTNCTAIVEPNFSVYADTPHAVALYATYRKRWLARLWQERGLTVWVDLFVGEGHMATNLLGVPRGWQRWATSATEATAGDLASDLETVLDRASGNPSTLLVYGGGPKVREWCASEQHHGLVNVLHVPHLRAMPTARARLSAGFARWRNDWARWARSSGP